MDTGESTTSSFVGDVSLIDLIFRDEVPAHHPAVVVMDLPFLPSIPNSRRRNIVGLVVMNSAK